MAEERDLQTVPLHDRTPDAASPPPQVASNGAPSCHPSPSPSTAPTLSRRSKILRTILLYTAFILLGMMMSVLGPTLLDLQYISHSTTEQIAFVITGRSIGVLLGCLLSAVMIRYFDPWLTLGLCNILMGVTTIVLPLCYNVYALIVISVLQGIGSGEYDAGGNVVLLMIWSADNGPWMQALHLFYGVGTIFGPMIAEPFLVEIPETNTLNATMDGLNNTVENYTTMAVNMSEDAMIREESGIRIPYGIIGTPQVLIGLVFLAVFIRDGFHFKARKQNHEESNTQATDGQKRLKNMRLVIIGAVFIFYSVYCFVESELGSFLVLFCVKYLGWTKSSSAWLTAAFWSTFTLARAAGIIIVKFFRPQTILFADIVIGLIGALILVVFLVPSSVGVMWAGALIIGAGMASVYATGITWTEQYVRVTETVGSVFCLGAALSDMYGPILVVFLMEKVTYIAFIYVIVTAIVLMLVTMVVMQLLANRFLVWKRELEKESKGEGEEEPMSGDVITTNVEA